jgi:uncharacterized protein (TIGR00251 family)
MTPSQRSAAIRPSPVTLRGETGLKPETAGPRVYLGGGWVCVGVRVSPSAPRTELRGLHGDRLKVAVAAPPEDNRANRVLEEALADWLGLARGKVRVFKGHASRDKVVAFAELTEARLRELLGAALDKCRVMGDDGLAGQ